MNELKAKKGQSGFSLVELLVALTVFSIVLGAIYGLLRVGNLDRNRSSRRSDAMKNGRAALQLIGRDALNAGLSYTRFGASVPDDFLNTQLGFNNDVNTTRDLLTSVIPGNQVNTSNLQTGNTDMIAFVYRDVDFFNGAPISLTGATLASASGNTVTVNTKEDISQSANVGETVPSIYDLYIAEANGVRAIVMATSIPSSKSIAFAPVDPLSLNQALNGATADTVSLLRQCTSTITTNCMNYPGSLKRIFLVTYRVTANGTLVRTIYGNNTGGGATNQKQEQPIAYGIKDLQIRYTISAGTTSDDPTVVAGNSDPARRNDIRQVTVTLIAQDGIDEATGKAVYVTLDGTFSTRNLEYDAG